MSDSKNINSIIAPLNHLDAHYLVYAKATYFPSFVSVYIPNKPFQKLLPNLEATSRLPLSSYKESEYSESNLERSLRLTRKKIKEYVLCNDFELFATFTFKADRFDINKNKTKMTNWLKNQRRRNGAFEYIIVSEFHKDQKAIHFHALIKGYPGKLMPSMHPRTGKQLTQAGREVYQFKSYTLGFSNVKKVDSDLDSQTKVSFYLMKYITKDMQLIFGKNRYRVSRGLKTPNTEDNPEKWYLHVKPDREYPVENGKIIEFNAGRHPLVDIFLEAHTPGLHKNSEQNISNLLVSGTKQRSLSALKLGPEEIESTSLGELH